MAWFSSDEVTRISAQLKIDEGVKYEIYNDSLGKPTFGIGHLILPGDPEYKQPIGQKVSEERVLSAFKGDLNEAIQLGKSIYPAIGTWPDEVQEILVNMTFNLGGNLRKFKKLGEALNNRDWNKAADEMMDSTWYKQVKSRAERLVARMRNVKEK